MFDNQVPENKKKTKFLDKLDRLYEEAAQLDNPEPVQEKIEELRTLVDQQLQ